MLRSVQYDAAKQPTVRYQREYTVKDHLGNLRLAYCAGQRRTLSATLEQDAATHRRESQQFDSLSVSAPVAVATALARSGTYAARLNAGGSAPQPLGPLTQLGVQKGDTVVVSAYGLYPRAQQHGFFFSLGAFLASLFHPAQAPAPGLEVQRRKDLPLLQVGVAAGLASIPQLAGGVPQAYLRVLVFNRDSALVSQQSQQLSKAAAGNYERLSMQVVLPQDGYVTAYVGSQSDVDVYFDDVQVEHRPGLQVQENQYDPWGLSLAGLDYATPGIQGLNQYQFNGKEKQNDLGLGWSDYGARFYDAAVPHWPTVDPLASQHFMLSPYAFTGNNAVNAVDLDGRDFILTILRNKQGAITGIDISATVYITGAGASQERADELNKFAGDNLKHRKIDGVVVSLGVTYQYNPNKQPDDLKAGENLFTFDAAADGSAKAGGRHNISAANARSETETGNTGTIFDSGHDSDTVIHETLHLMGLSDRYDEREQLVPGYTNKYTRSSEAHTGFSNNRMANHKQGRLDSYQYLRYKLYGESLPQSQQSITGYPSTKFVDKNANGDLGTPYEKGGIHRDSNLTSPIH